MTVSQAAIVLQCSPRKVMRLIHSKQLPALRVRKRLLSQHHRYRAVAASPRDMARVH